MLRFARERRTFRRLAAGLAITLCCGTAAIPQSAAGASDDVTDGLVLRYDLDPDLRFDGRRQLRQRP